MVICFDNFLLALSKRISMPKPTNQGWKDITGKVELFYTPLRAPLTLLMDHVSYAVFHIIIRSTG